jgi:hypothetical protein
VAASAAEVDFRQVRHPVGVGTARRSIILLSDEARPFADESTFSRATLPFLSYLKTVYKNVSWPGTGRLSDSERREFNSMTDKRFASTYFSSFTSSSLS